MQLALATFVKQPLQIVDAALWLCYRCHIMSKELTAVRLEVAAVEALKKLGKKKDNVFSDRSVSWLIRKAVDEFIANHVK